MLTLYHYWSSTCSRKVRICLFEKDIEWESHHIDIMDKIEQTEPWYVKMNPTGVVPTIDHDGQIVIESNLIIEYLDDRFPGPSLSPEDPFERSQMRLWMHKAEEYIHKNINLISYVRRIMPARTEIPKQVQIEKIMRNPDPARRAMKLRRLENGVSDEEFAFARERITSVIDEAEWVLADNTWLAGNTYSLADIAMAPFIERMEANGLDELTDASARPAVAEWWGRLRARPAYKKAFAFKNPEAA